jgi:hypothetical protein
MAERKTLSSPVRISADGKYFVDSEKTPVFWLGDTQWELTRALSLEDAKKVLMNRKEKGFNFILVMLLGVGASGTADGKCDGLYENAYGERPWVNDNPSTPNEKYFKNVDAVLDFANGLGLTLVLGIYHARTGAKNPIQMNNAREWARWLGNRYKDTPNLIWSMFPKAETESLPLARELAKGLQEGDKGNHIIGVHPDPAPASSSLVFQREKWLAFNTIQTFKWVERIFPMVTEDAALSPKRPVVMAEGAYEEGIEYGFPITPLWVRRQAYYSCLAGGYHSYGHNDCWRVWSTWEKALEAPGASQMLVVRKVFTDRSEWWKLIPDQSIIQEGRRVVGDTLTLAARHPQWKWAIVYFSEQGECRIQVDKLRARGAVRMAWIDPRTGEETDIKADAGGSSLSFNTPPGWEDALLVLEGK